MQSDPCCRLSHDGDYNDDDDDSGHDCNDDNHLITDINFTTSCIKYVKSITFLSA